MDIRNKVTIFAVVSATLLALVKFVVGLNSGSMAVISSGLDSLLDVFMSAMNLFAIRKASKPADRDHQFGHGKAEDLASVIQSLVIIGSGCIIIYKAVQNYVADIQVDYSSFDLPVMIFSLLFSFVVGTVLKRVGSKTDSNILKADALHYLSDLYSNSGAVLAILLAATTGKSIFDSIFAVIIGVFIIFSAVRIFRRGMSGLMDASLAADVEREIAETLNSLSYPYAGYHKLRTRQAGDGKYIDFHLLVCRKLTIDEAHQWASKTEKELKEKIKRIDIVIHVEPCRYECNLSEADCTVLKMRVSRV